MADPRPVQPPGVVAVIGLGRMGVPMAQNLARAGFEVRGWNRTPKPAPEIAVCATAVEAVEGAVAVILLLSDRTAIDEVLFTQDLAASLKPGTIVIDMGTSGPLAARDHAARLRALDLAYLDAPVSGGVAGAESTRLTILVGGAPDVFDAAAPVLNALGTPHLLGGTGAGQTAKVANQMMVAGYIAAVAEGLTFAQRQGLDAAALVAALEGGFADSAVLRRHGRKMAARDFEPGGACRLHLKDLRLAADLANGDIARYANTAQALRRFALLARTGYAEADHSAYYLTYQDEAAS